MKNTGQAQLAMASIIGVISFGASWLGNYILNSPTQSANAINVVQTDVNKLDSRLTVFCNDYQQTVSRVDQNLQIIGRALKVSVVSGSSNSNPCQQK